MKKQVKRSMALLLTLVLLLSGRAFAAVRLEISSASGKQGERVTVEVSLSGDDAVYAGNFSIQYDHDELDLVSADKVGNWLGMVNPSDAAGDVRLSFSSVSTPVDTGVVCTLTFLVKAAAPVDGSALTIKNARFYGADGNVLTDVEVLVGTVSRDCVYVRLNCSDTVENQSVRVEVSLDGKLRPAGGNFTITYDENVLTPTAVLPLGSAAGAQFTQNLDVPGQVRISFAGSRSLENGSLCAVIFRAKAGAGSGTQMELRDVRAYDTDSQPLDTAVAGGSVSVVVPTEKDPKLWVVGGALGEDGIAEASVLLQGRGVVCGGQFTLLYDASMSVEVEPEAGVQIRTEPGKIHVSWASETPALGEQILLTVRFTGALESSLTFDGDVCLYDSDKPITVVDIRPGQITGQAVVTAVVDEMEVQETAGGSLVTVTVDLADVQYYTEEKTESVTPVLALYENGRLKGMQMQKQAELTDGVAEISLTAASSGSVTEYRVFVLNSAPSAEPLCPAMGSLFAQNGNAG